MENRFGFAGEVEIIAHRGFSAGAPENTWISIERAIEAGAKAVEFDMHVTADGVPVVFHDDTLDRTTDGSGPIAAKTFDQLRTLDAGSWFGSEFSQEPVPSLEGVLASIGDSLERVYAEVKGYREVADLDRMLGIAKSAGAQDRIVFISMDWAALEHMRRQDADIRVGYIVQAVRDAEAAIAKADGDASALLDFRASILLSDPPLAAAIAERGIPMAAWTIDDPEDAARLLDMGVPRITTNEVALLLGWQKGL